MSLSPLLSAQNPIPIHALLALAAIGLGLLQFALPKGTQLHRAAGYVWMAGMLIVALTSFFINEFRWVGPFGPIHLLSCYVLWSVWRGVTLARRGQVAAHRAHMIALYWQGLLLTGALTLLPGRVMHTVVFG